MPRRGDVGVTIGVAGVGDVDPTTSKELLDDYINSPEVGGKVTFLFEVTEETLTDAMEDVTNYAYSGDYDFHVITTTDSLGNKKIKELADASQKTSKNSDPDTRFLQMLEASPNPVFFCLYDEKDELCVQQAEKAAAAGIPVHDFTDGLVELDFQVAEEGDAAEEEVEEPEEDEASTVDEDQEQGEEEEDMTTFNEVLDRLATGLEEIAGDIRVHLEGANGVAPEVDEDEVEEPEEEEEPAPRTRRTATKAAAKKAPAKKAGGSRRGRPRLPRDAEGNIVRDEAPARRTATKKAPAKKAAASRTAGRRTGRRTRA
jgi:hypothetical protein